jgi:splicing factor 3B subunit 3
VNLFENNSIIQVVSNGFRHIKDKIKVTRISFEGKILRAASNQRQLVLALAGGDLIYYEVRNTVNVARLGGHVK